MRSRVPEPQVKRDRAALVELIADKRLPPSGRDGERSGRGADGASGSDCGVARESHLDQNNGCAASFARRTAPLQSAEWSRPPGRRQE